MPRMKLVSDLPKESGKPRATLGSYGFTKTKDSKKVSSNSDKSAHQKPIKIVISGGAISNPVSDPSAVKVSKSEKQHHDKKDSKHKKSGKGEKKSSAEVERKKSSVDVDRKNLIKIPTENTTKTLAADDEQIFSQRDLRLGKRQQNEVALSQSAHKTDNTSKSTKLTAGCSGARAERKESKLASNIFDCDVSPTQSKSSAKTNASGFPEILDPTVSPGKEQDVDSEGQHPHAEAVDQSPQKNSNKKLPEPPKVNVNYIKDSPRKLLDIPDKLTGSHTQLRTEPKDCHKERTSTGMSSDNKSPCGDIGIEPDSNSTAAGQESRSRRIRKPSQKVLMNMESSLFDDFPLSHGKHSNVLSPNDEVSPTVSGIDRTSPIHLEYSFDEATTSCGEAADDSPSGEKAICCACQLEADMAKTMILYSNRYCNACLYVLKKFVRQNVLPECKPNCDGNNLPGCKRCRAIRVNATMPQVKRIRLNSEDSRLPLVMAAIESYEKQKPAGNTAINKIVPNRSATYIRAPSDTAKKQVKPTLASPVTPVRKPQNISAVTLPGLSSSKPVNSMVVKQEIGGDLSPPNKLASKQLMSLVRALNSDKPHIKVISQKQAQSVMMSKASPGSSKPVQVPVSQVANIAKISKLLAKPTVVSKSLPLKTLAPSPTPGSPQKYVISTKPDGQRVMVALKPPASHQSNIRFITPPNRPVIASPITPKLSGSGIVFPTSPIKVIEHTTPKAKSTITVAATPTGVKPVQSIQPVRIVSMEPVSSGPRVKHVSRSATVVQGELAVIKPAAPDVRLSALPTEEKAKIWESTKVASDDDDDAPRSKSHGGKKVPGRSPSPSIVSERFSDSDSDFGYKPVLAKKRKPMKIKTKFMPKSSGPPPSGKKRRPRCGTCEGCQADNCEVCVYCRDMKKYGGPGKMKQCCVQRRCINKSGPLYDSKTSHHDDFAYVPKERKRSTITPSPPLPKKRKARPPRRYQVDAASSIGSEVSPDDVQVGDELDSVASADFELGDFDEDTDLLGVDMTNKPLTELLRVTTRARSAHSSLLPQPEEKVDDINNLVTADGTLITDQNPGFSLVESLHRLMADFMDTYDIDKVWQQGVAVVTSAPQSVRVLCYLCGSAGHHQLTYCSVCCEPFHDFCLTESDRPKTPGCKDWVCSNCQFCRVCGKLNNLLTCVRCSKTYHAQCLGEGHMIEPNSASVWVCSSCVKCTSCGATSPGPKPEDKWNSDFSLCASCERLKLKGNYCPICGLCYSDDDWECKMIGCSKCDSWTHAQCENLSDDLYELIGYVGDDEAQYVCKRCSDTEVGSGSMVDSIPSWRRALESLRTKGFSIIIASLLDKKYCQPIAEIDPVQLKQFYDTHRSELESVTTKRKNTSSSSGCHGKLSTVVNGTPNVTSSSSKTSQSTATLTNLPSTDKDKVSTQTEAVTDKPAESIADSKHRKISKAQANLRSTEASAKQIPATTDRKPATTEKTPATEKRPASIRHSSRLSRQSAIEQSSLDEPDSLTPVLDKPAAKSQAQIDDRDILESSTPVRRSSRLGAATVIPPPSQTPEAKSSQPDTERRGKKRLHDDCETAADGEESSSQTEASPPHTRSSRKRGQSESTPTPAIVESPAPSSPLKKCRRAQPVPQEGHADSSISPQQNDSLTISESGCLTDELDLEVRFKDTEWIRPVVSYEALVKGGHPIDLKSIQSKINSYKTINDFLDDVVRVMQSALTRSKIQHDRTHKHLLTAKKLLENEVSQLFPWCEMKKSPFWDHNACVPKGMLEQACLPPNTEHTYAKWINRCETHIQPVVQPSPYKQTEVAIIPPTVLPVQLQSLDGQLSAVASYNPTDVTTAVTALSIVNTPLDSRRCQLCSTVGDDKPNEAGRLIYAGADDWIHVNCALWSAEVFEEVDGTLQRVHTAIHRGKQLECSVCQVKGATVGCCAKNCISNYHFKCARLAGCTFMNDKQVFCPSCTDSAIGPTVEEDKFSVLRTVTVDFSHVKMKKSWQKGFKPEEICIVAGSMTVEQLGFVLPESDYLNHLVPVDYHVSRIYWSTKVPHQRCVYTCKVIKVDTTSNVANITASNVTICHDPSLATYTPPELLTTKYPDVFPPEKYDSVLSRLNSTDPMNDMDFSATSEDTGSNLQVKKRMPSLSQSWPSSKPTAMPTDNSDSGGCGILMGLSERTRRLLGRVSPSKLERKADPITVDGDLSNLVGIAAALNKAARRSQRRRFKKARREARVMYGCSDPAVSGNIDDDVAEILDLVESDGLSEETLEEREVVILRDVDNNVANEVIKVIEKMTEQEAKEQGGVEAVMQRIVNKYKHTRTDFELKRESRVEEKGMSSPRPDDDTMIDVSATPQLHQSDITAIEKRDTGTDKSQSDSSSGPDIVPQPDVPSEKDTRAQDLDSKFIEDEHTKLVEPGAGSMDDDLGDDMLAETTHPDSTTSSSSSFHAYSSPSSNDSDDSYDANPVAPDKASPVISPPKIVITDFSMDEPTDVTDADPFRGIQSADTSPSVSSSTKSRLMSLVRRRSESLAEMPSIRSRSLEDTTRKYASLDEASMPSRSTSETVRSPLLTTPPNTKQYRPLLTTPPNTEQRPPLLTTLPITKQNMPTNTEQITPSNTKRNTVSSLPLCAKAPPTSTTCEPSSDIPPQTTISPAPRINTPPASIVKEQRDSSAITPANLSKPVSAKSNQPQSTRQLVISTGSGSTASKEIISDVAIEKGDLYHSDSEDLQLIKDNVATCKSGSIRRRKYKGVKLKSRFSNDLYADSLSDSELDSLITTRDRSPVVSDDDLSNSDLSDVESSGPLNMPRGEDSLERIIVPPGVNCIVRDEKILGQLASVLNASVHIDRLIFDTEEEMPELDNDIMHPEPIPEPFQVPNVINVEEGNPALKDVSREIRKDIINYCEETGSESSTDEEELCRPRALRKRDTTINYNENQHDNQIAQKEAEPNQPRRRGRKPKPRPTTEKITIDKDGQIRSRSENIPSALQKTISDAIRKARSRNQDKLQYSSSSQAYMGAGQCGSYSMKAPLVGSRPIGVVANQSDSNRELFDFSSQPKLKSRQPNVATDLSGEDCQLTMMSSDIRKSHLPLASMEEEVIGGSGAASQSVEQTKPSSVFLAFQLESDDGFVYKADNWNDVWRGVTDAVRDLRIASGLPALSFSGVSGLHMFGLEHTSVSYFTEQLYGARYCHQYRFKFHKPPLFEYEQALQETVSGSSRSEPFTTRKEPEMFSFLDSRYRMRPRPVAPPDNTNSSTDAQPSRRATSLDLPMAMRFRHLKHNAKEATAVYRSNIHGRGLVCRRQIDAGEMVIEYAGEVIRHELCDKREKYYESRNIGCYMFRIDENLVVDATMNGNAARFINHSCDPNCFSKVIDVGGEKHIVIFALRTIYRGEELTYDYKFPFEEVKIPCTCGARRCRGYLN